MRKMKISVKAAFGISMLQVAAAASESFICLVLTGVQYVHSRRSDFRLSLSYEIQCILLKKFRSISL